MRETNGDWLPCTLGDALQLRTEKGVTGGPLLSVLADRGVVPQSESGRRDISSADKTTYRRVYPGDIVYNTMRMWQGVSGRSNYHGIVSPAYTVCQPAQGVDARFIAHLLRLPQLIAEFKNRSQGLVSDTWNLKYSSFKTIPVRMPPEPEQKRIVELLDSVDESIRSTERTSAKLEATRGGAISAILQEGADWTPFRLSDILVGSPKNGYSPKEVDTFTGTLMLGLGCLTPNGFIPRQLKHAPAGDSNVRRAMLSDGDLLMSRANTRELVGLAGTFRSVGVPCIYPDLMMRLTPNSRTRTQFLEILLRSPSVRRQIEAQAVGTSESMAKISAAIVLNLKVAAPDLEEQDRVLSILASFNSQLLALRRDRDKLQRLKQGLVEDLLTGRVRVKVGEDKAA